MRSGTSLRQVSGYGLVLVAAACLSGMVAMPAPARGGQAFFREGVYPGVSYDVEDTELRSNDPPTPPSTGGNAERSYCSLCPSP